MNEELKRQELIDNYLDGKLGKTEVEEIEQKLASDADFREVLNLEKAARKIVQTAGRANLRSKLEGFEAEAAAPVRRLFPLRALAIAASILALIAAGLWLFQNNQPSTPQAIFADYFEPYRNPIFTRSGENNQENTWKTATEAYASGDYAKAIDAFRESLNYEETITYLANFYLGLSYLSQDSPQPQEAITALDQVFTSDNDYHQQALWYKALAYLNQNNKSQAILSLKELLNQGDFKRLEAENILNSLEE